MVQILLLTAYLCLHYQVSDCAELGLYTKEFVVIATSWPWHAVWPIFPGLYVGIQLCHSWLVVGTFRLFLLAGRRSICELFHFDFAKQGIINIRHVGWLLFVLV